MGRVESVLGKQGKGLFWKQKIDGFRNCMGSGCLGLYQVICGNNYQGGHQAGLRNTKKDTRSAVGTGYLQDIHKAQ